MVYCQKYPLRSSDADFAGNLRMDSLIQILTDAGWAHAHQAQIGIHDLQQKQLTWVNVHLRLEVKFPIQWQQDEPITVKTWLAECNPPYWIRDFLLLDSAGNELARASTSSVLLDMTTRRLCLKSNIINLFKPADVPRVFTTPNARLAGLRLFETKSNNIASAMNQEHMQTDWERKQNFVVRLGALDSNRHVSNAQYARWLLDHYDLAFCQRYRWTSVELRYLKEALYGQELTLLSNKNQVYGHSFCLINEQETKPQELLQARICWQPC